ncbi:cell division protein ZipA [Bowmanella sp. Y26]|uniref:cell division protein ZipA n=1 Tax=Bowmanella yangjiangensis TaxID=2811230 RepID=UPI001BDD157D|nr:cell division protein ZipA [Bowmanella yangjiangensis]MBT1063613.1 cell division protein ZipA [Bowmanella yangjiangensis]
MEELRLTFLVFGALAIAGILVHGLWTVRKKNAKKRQDKPAFLDYQARKQAEPQFDGDSDFDPDAVRSEPQLNDFDELGLGPVRVVKSAQKKAPEPVSQEPQAPAPEPVIDEVVIACDKPEPVREESRDQHLVPEPPSSLLRKDSAKIDQDLVQSTTAQAVRQEPVLEPQVRVPEAPEDNLNAEQPVVEAPAVKPGFAEQARNLVMGKKPDATPKRREPQMRNSKLREDQMRIDFDDEPAVEPKPETAPAQPAKPVNQEVLVLNIKSPDNKPISGASLLPALLTLGFKFGEQDIFHRHVNSNGKGPVLFSLANMFKPGVFDVDNLETFSTQGLSLFMILPIEGDPHQVFNMMHNAARKLADEFGAQVLDGRRAVLTKQSLQQYVEKIREFERKRMIRKAN